MAAIDSIRARAERERAALDTIRLLEPRDHAAQIDSVYARAERARRALVADAREELAEIREAIGRQGQDVALHGGSEAERFFEIARRAVEAWRATPEDLGLTPAETERLRRMRAGG